MIKWQRDAGMFARRIVHSDLHGFVARGFIIEQGTKALFFENGVLQQVVRAGKIETSGLLTRLLTLDFHRRVEIVVCEAGDIHFAYLYGGENPQTHEFQSSVRTSDHVPLQTGVEMVFQLEAPELFMNNVFQGMEELAVPVLKGRYFKEIRDALREFVAKSGIAEISAGRDFKNRCAAAVEKHLALSLARDGFRLIQISSLSFYNPQWAELERQKSRIKIDGARQSLEFAAKQVELEQRERQIELEQREQEQEVRQTRQNHEHHLAITEENGRVAVESERQRVEQYQAQARLWQEMRSTENQERIHRAKSENELEAVLTEIDTAGIMRGDHKQRLLRQLREEDEDHERCRKFLNAEVEMEHRYALAAEDLSRDQALSQREFEFKLGRCRQQFEHDLSMEKAGLAARLEKERIDQIERIEAADREQIAELERKRRELSFAGDHTRAEAEMAEIAIQIQEKRAESGLSIREKLLAQKRRDHYERQKIELELEQGRLQLHQQREDNEFQRRVALRKENRVDRSQEYDHQRSLQELKIRATAIESERDVAIAQAQSGGNEKEAVIAEKKCQIEMQSQFQQILTAQNHSNADRLERIFDKSLHSISASRIGVSSAAVNPQPDFAEREKQPEPGPISGRSQGLRICTACGMQVDAGINFCENCGNQLR